MTRSRSRLNGRDYVPLRSCPKSGLALRRCRKTGATLLVAKFDRLSRNVTFLRSLIDSSVDVAFCDLPTMWSCKPGAFAERPAIGWRVASLS